LRHLVLDRDKKRKQIQAQSGTILSFIKEEQEYAKRESQDLKRVYDLFQLQLEVRLSSGSFGNVYGARNGHAVKVVDLSAESVKEFRKEISLAKKAALAGAGPSIFQTKITRSKPFLGIIEMEKMDMTLHTWLKQALNDSWVDHLLPLFDQLNSHGMFCEDLTLNNVMVNVTKFQIKKMVIIDFGADWCKRSQKHKSPHYSLLMKLIFYFNTRNFSSKVNRDLKPRLVQLIQDNGGWTKKNIEKLARDLSEIETIEHYFHHKPTKEDIDALCYDD
jgi:hypothetical protein